MIARSITFSPRCLARPITVRRVMPSRKQSGVGVCSTPSLHEEDVGAGRLGDLAAPVEHQRVGIALALGPVLLDGADHVEPGRLALDRRGARVGPAIVGDRQPQALRARGRIEIGAPVPGGDGDIDLGRLRGDAHLLAAAPGDRADIGVGQLVGARSPRAPPCRARPRNRESRNRASSPIRAGAGCARSA